jgi:hypothetical protein
LGCSSSVTMTSWTLLEQWNGFWSETPEEIPLFVGSGAERFRAVA